MATVSEVGRRERKRQATRDALAEAARSLFVAKGFDQTTVDDIAEAADVSARTFFRHFGSKEDVLFDGHGEQLHRLADALADRPAGEPVLVSVQEALLSLVGELEAQRDQILIQATVAAQSPTFAAHNLALRDQLSDVIAGFVAERLGVDALTDIRPRLMGGVVFAAISSAVAAWAAEGGDGDLTGKVRRAIALLSEPDFGLSA